MLRTFTAALLATALIAGPALAQTNDTTKPAAQAAPTTQSQITPAKPAKHAAVKHAKKHRVSRAKGSVHQARHFKTAKTHQASTAKAGNRS